MTTAKPAKCINCGFVGATHTVNGIGPYCGRCAAQAQGPMPVFHPPYIVPYTSPPPSPYTVWCQMDNPPDTAVELRLTESGNDIRPVLGLISICEDWNWADLQG